MSTTEDKNTAEIHPSHDMSAWTSEMIQIASTPRFGRIRQCNKCNAEQASTVAGSAMHDQLRKKCHEVNVVE